jgi:predicted TIM-barrel fold metal-dependent hydrolase
MLLLGGLGMKVCGHGQNEPLTSSDIVRAHFPWYKEVFRLFGEDRVFFESNFPMDKNAFSYLSFWNAAKIMTAMLTKNIDARRKLLFQNANRIYSLGQSLPSSELYAYASSSSL